MNEIQAYARMYAKFENMIHKSGFLNIQSVLSKIFDFAILNKCTNVDPLPPLLFKNILTICLIPNTDIMPGAHAEFPLQAHWRELPVVHAS